MYPNEHHGTIGIDSLGTCHGGCVATLRQAWEKTIRREAMLRGRLLALANTWDRVHVGDRGPCLLPQTRCGVG